MNALASAAIVRWEDLETRVNIGRYRTYYCADDITFGYLWRWDQRNYRVAGKYYGGIRPRGLRALISHINDVR